MLEEIERLKELHSEFLQSQINAFLAIYRLNKLDRQLSKKIFKHTSLCSSLLVHVEDEDQIAFAAEKVTNMFTLVLPNQSEIALASKMEPIFAKRFDNPDLDSAIKLYANAQLKALVAVHRAVCINHKRAAMLFGLDKETIATLQHMTSSQALDVANNFSFVFVLNFKINKNIIADSLKHASESSLYTDSAVIYTYGENV